MARIQFETGEEILCDRCADIFAEVVRHGPQVVAQAHEWKLSTRVMRMSAVHDYLQCGKCLQKHSSHLFIKFFDVSGYVVLGRRNGAGWQTKTKGEMRCCSQCAMTYLFAVRAVEMYKAGFPYGAGTKSK
jgi:hypothetical protein